MRKTKYLIMIIALIFVFVMGVYLCAEYYSDKYSENLLRFHILANSNSPEDQALKIKVRDHLSKTIFSLTENSKDALETEKIIEKNKEFIIEEAEKFIKKEGYDYEVNIETGNFYFPTKQSLNRTLPAGEYEAVKIIIGEGKGDNWWCVLFPPLCFSDSEVKVKNEYSTEKEDTEQFTVKFKIVDFFQEVKHKFNSLFDF